MGEVNDTYAYYYDLESYEDFKRDDTSTGSDSDFDDDDDDNGSVNAYYGCMLRENEDGNRTSSKTVLLMGSSTTQSETALFQKTLTRTTSSCIREGRFSTKNDSNSIKDATMYSTHDNRRSLLLFSKPTSTTLTTSTSSSTLASTTSSSSVVSFDSKVEVRLYRPPIEEWANQVWLNWFAR